jgi:hypothetical protein
MIERFIDIWVEKDTPEDVLLRLREIDPMAELFYAGSGWWWMGVVKPDAPRVEEGKKWLNHWADKGLEQSWPVMRLELLKSQGFGLCGKYRFGEEGADFGALVEDFRFADFVYRNWGTSNPAVEAQIQDSGVLEDEIKLKARAATIERIKADNRYLFSRLVRQNPAPVPVGVDLQ